VPLMIRYASPLGRIFHELDVSANRQKTLALQRLWKSLLASEVKAGSPFPPYHAHEHIGGEGGNGHPLQ